VGIYEKVIVVNSPNNADKVYAAITASSANIIAYEIFSGVARKIMYVADGDTGAYSIYIINGGDAWGGSWGSSWGTTWTS
jgi:hypothetical protein